MTPSEAAREAKDLSTVCLAYRMWLQTGAIRHAAKRNHQMARPPLRGPGSLVLRDGGDRVIFDLGAIPVHARRAFADEHGIFFDLSPDLGDTRAREHAAAEASAPEGPPRQSAPQRRQASGLARVPRGFTIQPVQALLALAGILLLSMGPAASGRAAGARPPAAPLGVAATSLTAGAVSPGSPSIPGAASAVGPLLAELDLAARRIEALEAHRSLTGECAVPCVLGVEWVKVGRAEVECRCRKVQSLGVYRFAQGKGAGLQNLARSSSPQPGAVAESGGAGPSGGGSR